MLPRRQREERIASRIAPSLPTVTSLAAWAVGPPPLCPTGRHKGLKKYPASLFSRDVSQHLATHSWNISIIGVTRPPCASWPP